MRNTKSIVHAQNLNKYFSLDFINQIPALFTVVDKNSKILAANSTALNWLGYDLSEIITGVAYNNFPCRVSETHDALVE